MTPVVSLFLTSLTGVTLEIVISGYLSPIGERFRETGEQRAPPGFKASGELSLEIVRSAWIICRSWPERTKGFIPVILSKSFGSCSESYWPRSILTGSDILAVAAAVSLLERLPQRWLAV